MALLKHCLACAALAAALPSAALALDSRAMVPQITAATESAFVAQLPRGSRPAPPAGPSQPAAAARPAAPRDFIFDFGGREAELALPSVREGIRLTVNGEPVAQSR